MRSLPRLLFCVAAFGLVTHCFAEDYEPENGEMEDEGEDGEMGDEEHDTSTDQGEEPENEHLTPENMKGIHGKIDKNGDGKISLAEIMDFSKSARTKQAHRKINEHLELYDQDKDGKVSEDEMMQEPEESEDAPPMEPEEKAREEAIQKIYKELEMKKFKAADKNGDGLLDTAELPAVMYPDISDEMINLMAAHTLKHKDTNGDGELDLKELFYPEHEAPVPEEEQKENAENDQKEFKMIDLDGSGKLNLKELAAFESGEYYTLSSMREFIKHADADKDSHVSMQELESHINKLKESEAGSQFNEWISDGDEL